MIRASVVAALVCAPVLLSQSRPKFEVASVKPCASSRGEAAGKGSGGGAGGGIGWSADRLHVRCVTLDNLIRDAYLSYPQGKRWAAATRQEATPEAFGVQYGGGCIYCGRGVAPVSMRLFRQPIEGSPAWASTQRFSIEAKAERPTTPEMMRGPMMQILLEERFRLKIRRESKAAPVYELTAIEGGVKLNAAKDEGCTTGPPASREGGAPQHICGRGGTEKNGTLFTGITLAKLASDLSAWVDRDVVDKTGIPGVFDIYVDAQIVTDELTANEPAPDGAPPRPPDINRVATYRQFRAGLEKAGLRLEPAEGTGPYLVIEHVERPSEN